MHRALPVLTETIQPGHDDPLDGVGHAHLGKLFDETIVAILLLEHTEIQEGLGDFLDEQRYPFRLRHEGRLELLRELCGAQIRLAMATVSAAERLWSVRVV